MTKKMIKKETELDVYDLMDEQRSWITIDEFCLAIRKSLDHKVAHNSNTRVNWDGDTLFIREKRLETDIEYSRRLRYEADKADAQECEELAMLQRLKAKYEPQ